MEVDRTRGSKAGRLGCDLTEFCCEGQRGRSIDWMGICGQYWEDRVIAVMVLLRNMATYW